LAAIIAIGGALERTGGPLVIAWGSRRAGSGPRGVSDGLC